MKQCASSTCRTDAPDWHNGQADVSLGPFVSYRWSLMLSTLTSTNMMWCADSVEGGSLVVMTPSMNKTAQKLTISLQLSDMSLVDTGYKFDYLPNPTFTDIQPRNHLLVWVFDSCTVCLCLSDSPHALYRVAQKVSHYHESSLNRIKSRHYC